MTILEFRILEFRLYPKLRKRHAFSALVGPNAKQKKR